MSNPFEDSDGRFIVLTNIEGQHSLWPESIQLPAGWIRTFGPETQTACTAFVETNWTDMRPISLRDSELNSRSHSDH